MNSSHFTCIVRHALVLGFMPAISSALNVEQVVKELADARGHIGVLSARHWMDGGSFEIVFGTDAGKLTVTFTSAFTEDLTQGKVCLIAPNGDSVEPARGDLTERALLRLLHHASEQRDRALLKRSYVETPQARKEEWLQSQVIFGAVKLFQDRCR